MGVAPFHMTYWVSASATAQAIVAAIDDISRFNSAYKLAAYFGLVHSLH